MSERIQHISDETRQACIDVIIANIDELDDREPGILFAGELLDKILEVCKPDLQKKTVDNIKKIIDEKMQDLDVELDLIQ